MRARPLLAVALLSLAACASSRVSITGEIKYGKDAEQNYQYGQEELKAEHWPEAQKFFEHVRARYPFSKYAALAELRLADAKFLQGRYQESAEAYQAFAQLHPTHEDADYAEYRAALSRYQDAPADFVLFPPAHEKDQRQVAEAVKLLEGFLAAHRDSRLRPDVEKLLAQARSRLAEHEWYVADFYWTRQRWAGVTGRLEGLVKQYPGSRHEPEALLRLAKAWLRLDERFRAQQALQRLLARHPADPRRAEAEALLASLR
jgi:outer membrane protein assembly factor BamD